MKITIYSTHEYDRPYLEKAIGSKHEVIFLEDQLNIKSAEKAKGSEAVALFTSDVANEEVITALHKSGVKYIALRSVGYDHIDLKICRKLGIKVANVPEYSPASVAEHAMALLLCLNRKILLSQKQIDQQDFRIDNLVGFDLKSKTFGIVGTGKIGSALARIVKGFGCNILAYDITENAPLKKELNINYVSLDELCKKSDIISLHCPLSDSTKHLMNREKFLLMKKGVFIINTSRGSIIKTSDLIEALENKIIGAAGLDVYEFEKDIFFRDLRNKEIRDNVFGKLRAMPNVLITGHQAFLTKEALTNIAHTTLVNISCWAGNKNSPHELFPDRL